MKTSRKILLMTTLHLLFERKGKGSRSPQLLVQEIGGRKTHWHVQNKGGVQTLENQRPVDE